MPLSYFGQLSIHSNLTLHMCYIMFQEKVAGTFKEIGRIKYSCNFSVLKPEERCLSRNTQQFQGLGTVGTHVTHDGNNIQSYIVRGTKNFHQEINKHLSLSASVNQVASYWLLPLFMETKEHEDQGMICNTACSAVASKVLEALNTATLLIEMQVLFD